MNFIEYGGIAGSIIGCFLIIVESIIPIIPLAVFITINFLVYGNILGFIISWFFTVIGCILSYYLFKKGFGNRFENLTENKKVIKKYTKLFKNITISKLTLLIAIPFAPAFAFNVVAGLTKMDFKKYLIALLIGKISLVYFWGYIGTSLVESLGNPVILIKIGIILAITYIISKIVNKILKVS